MKLKFSLRDLLLLTALISVACAALANAGIWWHSIVVTATLSTMTGLTIWGVLHSGPRRAFAAGWLLFAAGYLSLMFGPWTSNQLGPSLITAKGLAQLEFTTRGNNPSDPVLLPAPQTDFASDLSLIYTGNTIYSAPITTPPARIWASTGTPTGGPFSVYDSPVVSSYSTFQSTGHWLLASIFGFCGAHLAVFLYLSRQSATKN